MSSQNLRHRNRTLDGRPVDDLSADNSVVIMSLFQVNRWVMTDRFVQTLRSGTENSTRHARTNDEADSPWTLFIVLLLLLFTGIKLILTK